VSQFSPPSAPPDQMNQRGNEDETATGFSVGLLAHLVGPAGTVMTIELDDDLIDGARTP
jgi:protein-L-isoaspartate(D-aspartate) O-methyltransferase